MKENWNDSKELIEYYIEFLSHKIEIEKDYSNGLERLTRAAVFNRGKNTMIPSLSRMQTCCSQKSMSLNQLIEQQQKDLIPSLKNLLSQQDEIAKTKTKIGKDLDSEMQKHTKLCQKAKENYFNICQQTEVPSKTKNPQRKNTEKP